MAMRLPVERTFDFRAMMLGVRTPSQ